MHLADIDYLAVHGGSWLHKASVKAKLLWLAIGFVGTFFVREPIWIGFNFGLLLVMILTSGISLKTVLTICAYPLVFSSLFVLTGMQWGTVSWLMTAKVLISCLFLVTVITTTPYVAIFAVLYKVLPGLIPDALLMIYRIFFVMLHQAENFVTALRLRGGYSPLNIFATVKAMTGGVGMLFIQAWEMSERMYQIMQIRGYAGKMIVNSGNIGFNRYDIGLVITLLMMVAVGVKV